MKNYTVIQENTFEKARKKIRENKNKKIIFIGDSDELNRKIIEKENIDVLLINQSGRKDFMKQRNSGFNQVMAKIVRKKDFGIGINIDEIINSNNKEKSEIIARCRQNIKLCNKNKIKMKFISFSGKVKRNDYDLKALGVVLGMPSWMVKNI